MTDGIQRPANTHGGAVPILVVGAAIVDDLDHPTTLLSARRLRPQGRWEFPGGKVETGEGVEEALHRELREELGVRVLLGSEIAGPDAGLWRITDHHVMRLWFATVVEGTPEPLNEHDELRYLPAGQWLSVNWLDGDVKIVEELIRRVLVTSAG